MDREEWLEWRKEGIGASDAIIIMERAPRKWQINTPYKLWLHKMGRLETEDNAIMAWGRDNEERALNWFESRLDCLMFSQKMFTHPKKPWMRATFDGISHDHSVSVEVKVCNKDVFGVVKSGKVPEIYKPQLIHQMEVKPTKHHFLCVYNPREDEGAFIEVKMDHSYLEGLLDREERFYACMVDNVAPQFTFLDQVSCEEDMRWIDMARIVDEKQRAVEEAESRCKMLKDDLDEAKERLIELSNHTSCEGGGYELTKIERKGRINYSSIPALSEIDLEPFRSDPTFYYRFSRQKV